MKINLKYGCKDITLNLPRDKILGVYTPKKLKKINQEKEIRKALDKPINSKKLEDIVKVSNEVAIVIDDITRSVPSNLILKGLLERLYKVKKENITVVVATGLHRKLTQEELKKEVAGLGVKIINHNPVTNLAYLGETSYGNVVFINKTVAEADVKILTGDVEFHQFVGYGGGAKSIFPGLADKESIRISHSRMSLEGAKPGEIKNNPVRKEIEEVGKMLGVDFSINVVLNVNGEIAKAFAGNMEDVFLTGVKYCDNLYKVKVPEKADAVLVSAGGFPKDINLYQAQKAIEYATRIVKKNGDLILVAECKEGYGSETCYGWMNGAKSLKEIFKKIEKKFTMGGHKAYQLAKAINLANVYIFSSIDPKMIRNSFMIPLNSVKEVEDILNRQDNIAVLPYGSSTLPVTK